MEISAEDDWTNNSYCLPIIIVIFIKFVHSVVLGAWLYNN